MGALKPAERDLETTGEPTRRDSGIRTAMGRVANDLFDDELPDEEELVAPISIRTFLSQLLWVCGDCGEHYPRSFGCPLRCTSCGAPRQHMYAPIED